MGAGRAVYKQRTVANVHLLADDLETIDDAAEALEQSRSSFIAKAAREKATRVLAARKGRSALVEASK